MEGRVNVHAELQMLAGIAVWQAEQRKLARFFDPIEEYDKLRPAIQSLQHETWEEKYDRLYRETRISGDQFGKTFGKQYRRTKAA